jgi:hypothetical protein
MPFNRLLFLLNAILLVFGASGQGNNIPIGDWRVHLPYSSVHSVEMADSKIYASSVVNAFYYDYTDNNITILSKVNGLNDIEITKIRYHQGLRLTVIGYSNGNVDLIRDDQSIININDISRKSIVGSKQINDIGFSGNYAYLCCDFGVCVLDLKKLEIKETYESLAAAGGSNSVYSCSFNSAGDSIFLATTNGVMVGRINQAINLMDYNNWYTYPSSQGIPNTDVRAVINYKGLIYAAVESKGLYVLGVTNWTKSTIPLDSNFRNIRISNQKLIICAGQRITVATAHTTYNYVTQGNISVPYDAIYDQYGNLWIGDHNLGLFTNKGSSSFYLISPNGPDHNIVFKLCYVNNNIIATAGGYNVVESYLGKPGEYYLFNNYDWWTVNKYSNGFPNFCKDLVKSVYNPKDQKVYTSSYGYGILVTNPDNTFDFIDDTIAGFTRMLSQPGSYVFLSDVAIDLSGNLCAALAVPNYTDPSFYIRKNGVWTSKSFGFEAARFPIQLIVDNNNYKWMRLRPENGGGLLVYDDKKNQYKYFTSVKGQGGLPSNVVRTIAKDLNGDIWVGTDGGVAIFYNTSRIFQTTNDASIPYFDGFPLLYNEFISCIKVDGGNRKWIGTKNGVWLLSDDGTEVINYFTKDNSPLLSNTIQDIEIHEKTGEVFIGTDKGIISYRGMSTASTNKFSDVKIFPNPVPSNFNGLISISGLATDAEVKVTDIFGTLIYQTKAEGGTAVWNSKNYNGRRASQGVYLVFAASSDGQETLVGKFAIE